MSRFRPKLETLEDRIVMAGEVGHDPDHSAMLNLVRDEFMDVISVASGDWDDPATWNTGAVPADGQDVWVKQGHTVRLDSELSARLHTVRNEGTFTVDPQAVSRLMVDTFVNLPAGSLEIGSEAAPVTGSFEMVFVDNGDIDVTWDPNLHSRGLFSHGRVRIYGAPTETWGPLGTLSAPDVNTTANGPAPAWSNHFEANLDRTVRFRSETKVVHRRGHVMLMHNADVIAKYFAALDLGRTDKSKPIVDAVNGNPLANKRGRYAFHLHRTGAANAPAVIEGAVVIGSPGWGIVNHSSNVNVRNCVARGVVGASFVTELGDEEGEFDRNLALETVGNLGHHDIQQMLDFARKGIGFWAQGPRVKFTNNVSAGHSYRGFMAFARATIADPGTTSRPNIYGAEVPFDTFSGNLMIGGKGGYEFWELDKGIHFLNNSAWGFDGDGFIVFMSADPIFEGGIFEGKAVGGNLVAIGGHIKSGYTVDRSVIKNVTFKNVKYAVTLPGDKMATLDGGVLEGVTADVLVELSIGGTGVNTIINVPADTTVHMLDRPRAEARLFMQLLAGSHKVTLNGVQIYFKSMSADYVPFPDKTGDASIPNEFVGKTNAQLMAEFGLCASGFIAPPDAVWVGEPATGYWHGGSAPLAPVKTTLQSAQYTSGPSYTLRYLWEGVLFTETRPLPLVNAWNLLTVEKDGKRYTFMVRRST